MSITIKHLSRACRQMLYYAVLFLPVPLVAQFAEWLPVSEPTEDGRWRVEYFEIDGIGYVAGGNYAGWSPTYDMWAYDPVADVWQEKDFFFDGRSSGYGFSHDGKGYILCGVNNFPTAQVLIYEPQTDSWSYGTPLPATGRHGMAGFFLNGKAYIVDGRTSLTTGLVNQTWAYDPVADSWEQRAPMPVGDLGATNGAKGFAINGKGYVMGGFGLYSVPSDRLWMYDPVADSWTEKSPLPALGRYYHFAWSHNGKGVIASGSYGPTTVMNDTWMYDPDTDSWTELMEFPAIRRFGGASLNINGRLFAAFGASSGSMVHPEVWEFGELSIGLDPAAIAPASIQAFPNPIMPGAGSELHLSGVEGPVELILTNKLGQQVHRQWLQNSGVHAMPIHHLPAGSYRANLTRNGTIVAGTTIIVMH